eukprot:31226-Pelagococcus_subviridis.AAC.2
MKCSHSFLGSLATITFRQPHQSTLTHAPPDLSRSASSARTNALMCPYAASAASLRVAHSSCRSVISLTQFAALFLTSVAASSARSSASILASSSSSSLSLSLPPPKLPPPRDRASSIRSRASIRSSSSALDRFARFSSFATDRASLLGGGDSDLDLDLDRDLDLDLDADRSDLDLDLDLDRDGDGERDASRFLRRRDDSSPPRAVPVPPGDAPRRRLLSRPRSPPSGPGPRLRSRRFFSLLSLSTSAAEASAKLTLHRQPSITAGRMSSTASTASSVLANDTNP